MLPQPTVADYRQGQALNGTTRTVVVQPRLFGTDNRVTLDAIHQLGSDRTRGIRFSLHTAAHAAVGFEMVQLLAQRVHAWGCHLQLHCSADQLLAHQSMLQRLPTPLVFDHLGRLPLPMGTAHPAFALIRGLLDQRRAWVKLSGAYLVTRQPHGQG